MIIKQIKKYCKDKNECKEYKQVKGIENRQINVRNFYTTIKFKITFQLESEIKTRVCNQKRKVNELST